MNRRILTRLILALAAVALVACSAAPDGAQTPENPGGPPVETAGRIVALTSLTADLVRTLDGDALVAIPGGELIQGDPRFDGLPVVARGRTEPDLEKIVALEPDLVVGAAGFHDRTLRRLEELNVPTLQTEIDGWDDLRSLTEQLAALVGADPGPLLERYEACLAKAPPRSEEALILVSRQPLLTPNKNSWAGDFLDRLNIKNVAADLQGQSPFEGYVTLSEEKVLEANPAALIVIDTGENLMEQLDSQPFWRELRATRNESVYEFDYFGLVNPGSLASIERTCDRLAGELKR